jgi:PIN like domain
VRILFDNNISPKVARAINELRKDPQGDFAVAVRDKFSASIRDIEWITALGAEKGWCVVSADLQITKNKAEAAAWRQTDLIGFFMKPALARLEPTQQTARLLFWLPILEDQVRIIAGPALFELPLKASSGLRQIRF